MKLVEIISLLQETQELEGVSIIGNEEVVIDGLNLCNRNTTKKSILSFAVSDRYKDLVANAGNIMALVVSSSNIIDYEKIMQIRNGSLIVSENPEVDFYKIHEFLNVNTDFYDKFDFPAQIGQRCKIDKTAVIDDGVIIGNNVTIGASTVVKRGSIIEDNTVIGCNTVIGSEGFQVIEIKDTTPLHITHVGRCHICSDVYIGDNTCICNSLFEGETYIGRGSKIDNLVHVGHNLYVGENAVITAHVILCGSAQVEGGVWIAPNASILNGVVVGYGAKVGLGSVVTRNVEPYSVVYGSPAKTH